MDLFKLVGTIAIENTAANNALAETSAQGEQTQSKLSSAFGKIGNFAATAGKVVATGLAAGGAAMGTLITKAVNLSGELEQNMGGSEAVFGQYAGKMQETAKSAFSNMGLSTSDFLATANKMGALFQGAGFSIQESSDLSAEAMQRAADVASIMGLDTSAAMEAIAGAAKGNFTMMDNLGVAMNDTTLNAYALEKGIGKTTQEMTNQEKIALAMELFLEKTAYAAGNYAKENETLAGSLGTAKAALTNFLDGSGDVNGLISAFSNAANVIVKNVKDIAPRLISGITEIVGQIIPMLPPLLQELLPPLIEGAVSLINGLVSALPSVVDLLVNSALPMLLTGVISIFNALISNLPSLISTIVSALPSLVPLLIDGLVSMILTICSNLPLIIDPIISVLPTLIHSIISALSDNLPILIEGLIGLVIAVVDMLPDIMMALYDATPGIIKSLLVALWNALPALLTGLGELVLTLLKDLGEWIYIGTFPWLAQMGVTFDEFKAAVVNAFNAVVDFLAPIIESIKNFFVGLWNKVTEVWDGICFAVDVAVRLLGSILDAAIQIITLPFMFIWENCKEYVFAAWEWIKEKVTAALNAVKSAITTAWNAVKSFLTPILETIKNAIITAWNWVKDKVTAAVNAIKTTVTNIWNSIKTAVSNAMTAIKTTVTNVWDNIKTAVSNAVNSVKTTVSNVFNSVKSTVTNVWNNIRSAIETPMNKAKDTIKGIIDKIKGFFSGAKFDFPKIKLPHFSISPSGWKIKDLLEGSVPKLGIEWYAKAMENPMVMTQPTVFGYNAATGSFMGGGEAGSEVVSGTNTLMNMIRAAVASQNEAVAYYLQMLVEMLADYFPQIMAGMERDLVLDTGALVGELAAPMNQELGKISARKERGR